MSEPQDVIRVDLPGSDEHDVRQVAEGTLGSLVWSSQHHERLPVAPSSDNRVVASLVLGMSQSNWSITLTAPSDARADSALRTARRFIFFGVRCE